jgi:hypothetical protein
LRFAAPAATSLRSSKAFSSEVGTGSRKENASKKDQWRVAPQIREAMRAEVERLVEEIKQSVGLLRRHL